MKSDVARLRVGLLLSTRFFEDFYGAGLGLTREKYLETYRNDWSWEWCRMLAGVGIEATIYVATTGKGMEATTHDGYRVRFLPLSSVVSPWVRYPVLERSPVGRWIGQSVNAAGMLRALRSAVQHDEIGVLCIQEYWTARFDVLVRAMDVPVVVVDQGLPDRHEVKLLKRGSFKNCAGAVVQTKQEAAKVARFGGNARRIPNAVDTSLFSPNGAPADRHTILCVGRLHDAQKRLSDVIRALALLPSNWRLEIAGTGPDQVALEQLARDLDVAGRVRYLGFVSDSSELRDLYRRATVVALPSAYEGLPMVLLEAMSCGTPVVGSDIAPIAEVIDRGRTGFVSPVGAPDRLAEALREAAARREEMGDAARAAVLSGYDQRVVGPRLGEMLRSAHSGAQPSRSPDMCAAPS